MTDPEQCERCGDGEIESKITLSPDHEDAVESTFRICLDCVRGLGEWYENPPNDNDRPEPADFGGGESTGVQDL